MASSRTGEVIEAMVAMFDTGDMSTLDETVHPDYLDHQGLGGEPIRGRSGFATVVAAARSGYAELSVVTADLIAQDDRASARLLWSGILTSGKRVDRQTIEIVHVEDRKAIEHSGRTLVRAEAKREESCRDERPRPSRHQRP